METRGKEDHDVRLFTLVLDLRVGHFLKGQRGHCLPDVEGLANGTLGVFLTHLGGEIMYAGNRKRRKNIGKKS